MRNLIAIFFIIFLNFFNSISSQEILLNTSFENTYSEISNSCNNINGMVANNWFENSCWIPNNDAVVSYFEDTTNPHSGDSCQGFTVSSKIMQLGQSITLQSQKLYTAGVWMRANTNMTVNVILRQADFPYESYVSKFFEVNSSWTYYSVNGAADDVNGFFMIITESIGTLYVDDASLIKEDLILPALPTEAVTKAFFGIHFHSTQYPWPEEAFNIGTVRMWDTGSQWKQVNTSQGVFNWTELDAHVNRAIANNCDIIYNLGLTPNWASARPNEPSNYNDGNAAEPLNNQYWIDWVTAVGNRYQGVIEYWEIWNEPNDPGFYSGTVQKLVELTKIAHGILKTIDANNKIVSPSPYQLGYLSEYFSLGGNTYTDIVGYHYYLGPNSPEYIYETYIPATRFIMENYGLADKPLWDTENGWPAVSLNDTEQRANVSRLLLMDWAAGAKRLGYYAWDEGIPTTLTAPPNFTTPTAAGQAFQITASYLKGSVMQELINTNGLWQIKLTLSNNQIVWVVWSPNSNQNFVIPENWTVLQIEDLYGNIEANIPTSLSVNELPQFLLLNEDALGIDTFIENNVIVYPNPAEDYFKIKGLKYITNIDVYDLLGRLIKSISPSNSNFIENSISVSEIETGTYILKIHSNNMTYHRRIIVK